MYSNGFVGNFSLFSFPLFLLFLIVCLLNVGVIAFVSRTRERERFFCASGCLVFIYVGLFLFISFK